jgi:hypothetical protein
MEAIQILVIPTEGTLGHLTPKEQGILTEFRTHVKDVMKLTDTKWDDWYLLRFCRARKFDLPKVITMWENFINWRKEKNVDNGIQLDFSAMRQMATDSWEHGYYSTSRDGYPVYIERYAKTDIDLLLKTFTNDQLKSYYTNSYEQMIHCIWPECSRAVGRRIDRTVTILDVKGFGVMRMTKSDTRAFLNMATQVAQDYYPECQGKMFIINTGMTFSALWAIVKLWLDEKTRKKITVLGSKYMKELSKYVDPANLPKSMGGENSKEVYQANGPWTEYVAKCNEEKTYFADGVVQGDPWKEDARKAK